VYIKIYFNDKPLFLCDEIDADIQPYVHHDDAVFIDELNVHTLKAMIHEMEQPKIHAGIFFHQNLEELKLKFFSRFTLVPAAGGVVKNENDEILLIFRRGKWDLPKGKLDKNESPEDGAVREVKEETGLKNIKLLSRLTITYHTYQEGTRYLLKESHWFLMKAKSGQMLLPQIEEEIDIVRWAKKDELPVYLMNSYASVADVLQVAMKKIK
jgi:ADP-ribose pyrophosphatase YjhB (NUDIX family)